MWVALFSRAIQKQDGEEWAPGHILEMEPKASDKQVSPRSLAAVTQQTPSCHLEKIEGLQT